MALGGVKRKGHVVVRPDGRRRKLSMALAQALKRALKTLGLGVVRDLVCLLAGWVHFRRAGTTPQSAHWALVSLFCRTGGFSNDLIHRLIARRRQPFNIDGEGVLDLREQALQQITSQLRERGYYVFERRLPPDLRDRLLEFALAEKAVVSINKQPAVQTYGRKNPKGGPVRLYREHHPAE